MDKDEVLVVRVDVGRLVNEDVREHVIANSSVSVDLKDIVSPSWWTMSCLFPLKENPKTHTCEASR